MLLPTFENPATAPVLMDIPGAPVKKRKPRTAKVWGPPSRTGLRNQKAAESTESTVPAAETRATSTDIEEVESDGGDGPDVSMNGVDDDLLDSGHVDKETVPSSPAPPGPLPDVLYHIPEYRPYYEAIGLQWPEGGIES